LRRLLADGHDVVGLDNLNAYYDPRLKEARLAQLEAFPNFRSRRSTSPTARRWRRCLRRHRFPYVVNLAAQAGVRHSLIDPHAYADANLTGFLNVLEGCRHSGCRHLLYASSSSVYGANTRVPFRTSDNVDHPLSLYGATKKANELMAHAYAHLFALPATGLRFFTVYGPWGRPDMAMWIFAEAIMAGRPIKLFNHGQCDAILLTSMTSPNRWRGWSPARRRPTRRGRATHPIRPPAARPGASTISATASRSR
jgi:UDP-glucuronate 4-epimerase